MGDEENTKSGACVIIPWEAAEPRRFWSSLWATTWWCLRRPLSFFAVVANCEDRWPAMSHAMVMHVVGFSCAAFWSLLLGRQPWELWLLRVALAPLWVLVAVWAGSEMMHRWLSLFRGTSRSRSTTHRALAYCYCTVALGLVPVAGLWLSWIMAGVWQVMAMRQVHRAAWWKAVLAVVLTWAPLLVLLVLALLSPG